MDWNLISFVNVVTLYCYRIVRNKEGMSSILEKIIKEQIDKTPGKYLEMCDLAEKSGVILNNLDLLIKKINISSVPVEIGRKLILL